jgi:phosphotriesterase-related protein
VVLGHSGDTTDVDHLSALADAGFLLGFDRFGLHVGTTFEDRAGTLVEMCRRGYAESIVLSQDAACYIDWIAPDLMPLLADWTYTHVHDAVLPWIRERGVTDEQIETMLVTNPRRYFETAGGS